MSKRQQEPQSRLVRPFSLKVEGNNGTRRYLIVAATGFCIGEMVPAPDVEEMAALILERLNRRTEDD